MHLGIILSLSYPWEDTPNRVKNLTLLRDYSEDELITLWNLLSALDINDTDPDILYTVELYQITCGQNILINRMEVAGSNVTEESLDLKQIYKLKLSLLQEKMWEMLRKDPVSKQLLKWKVLSNAVINHKLWLKWEEMPSTKFGAGGRDKNTPLLKIISK